MKKYVAFIPSGNEYIQKTDLAFIKRHIINGNIVKTYTGSKFLNLSVNYALRNGYTLIVAILNHLGDNPGDILKIHNKLGPDKLICCDCNMLTEETIPLLFDHCTMHEKWRTVFNQESVRLNKRKGYKLGNPNWRNALTHQAQKKGADINKLKSQMHSANQIALPEILRLRNMGSTWQAIADWLNDNEMRTTTGKFWIASSVSRIYNRNRA